MPSRNERSSTPPAAPPSERKVSVPIGQIIGIALFSLLPILAVFDRFGTKDTRVATSSEDVSLVIEYAPRVRYGLPTQVKIEARATEGRSAGPVTVRLSREFIDRFAQISVYPEPDEMGVNDYTFVLPASETGGLVLIELEPERYGPVRGSVVASTGAGGAEARVELSAFIFP